MRRAANILQSAPAACRWSDAGSLVTADRAHTCLAQLDELRPADIRAALAAIGVELRDHADQDPGVRPIG